MRKKIIFLSGFLLTLIWGIGNASTENLTQNPGFEGDWKVIKGNAIPVGYKLDDTPIIKKISTNPHTGKYCVRIEDSSIRETEMLFCSFYWRSYSDKTGYASVWVRADNPGKASIMVTDRPGHYFTKAIETTSFWQKVEVNFAIAKDATRFQVYLCPFDYRQDSKATGIACFDDLLVSINSSTTQLSQKPILPAKKSYFCFFTTRPIKVDGLLDEEAWQKAQTLSLILPEFHTDPIGKTEARLLWDKNYLYVAFKAYDKDIWGYYKRRDDPTYQDDALEIFFKIDPEETSYYNFEINALNTVYDAFNVRRQTAGGSRRWSKWNCKGLKSAIKIKGTLNNWGDKDNYWSLEVAIPFNSLPTLKDKGLKPKDKWLFHLARCNYSVFVQGGKEFSSCAPLSTPDFHWYEDWLPLVFIANNR